MRALLIAALASLATASGARAQDIAQLPLGSEIQTFVAAPDGGAWVEITPLGAVRQRLGRVTSDGRFRDMPTGLLTDGAAGLDGHACTWRVSARSCAWTAICA